MTAMILRAVYNIFLPQFKYMICHISTCHKFTYCSSKKCCFGRGGEGGSTRKGKEDLLPLPYSQRSFSQAVPSLADYSFAVACRINCGLQVNKTSQCDLKRITYKITGCTYQLVYCISLYID